MSQRRYGIWLTMPEIDHIYNLLIHNGGQIDGHYYGNRKQYEDRAQRILKKLELVATMKEVKP